MKSSNNKMHTKEPLNTLTIKKSQINNGIGVKIVVFLHG